jgi:hypothetical protein
MDTVAKFVPVYLRLALGTAFLSAVADRVGLWGPPGARNWGGTRMAGASAIPSRQKDVSAYTSSPIDRSVTPCATLSTAPDTSCPNIAGRRSDPSQFL